jgi:hypothetical protein
MANSSRTRPLIITRQCYTAPFGHAVPTVSVGRELKYSPTSSCMRSISIRQEAGYGRLVMSPIPASRRSAPTGGDARKGVPYRDSLSQHRGLARFGRIDRTQFGPIGFGVVGPKRARSWFGPPSDGAREAAPTQESRTDRVVLFDKPAPRPSKRDTATRMWTRT